MNIVPASQNSFVSAIRLLQASGLPTNDITPGTQLFVIEEGDRVIATIAVEYNWNVALLRSLSVTEDHRNRGIGKELVDFIENYVKQQGVQTIFVLTATAANFFSNRGYKETNRNSAPEFIQNTSEFSTICSPSATLLKKELLIQRV